MPWIKFRCGLSLEAHDIISNKCVALDQEATSRDCSSCQYFANSQGFPAPPVSCVCVVCVVFNGAGGYRDFASRTG